MSIIEEFGAYGQVAIVGGFALGYDSYNGITGSHFVSTSIMGLSGDIWTTWSVGAGYEGVTGYVGVGTPSGTPGLAINVQQKIVDGKIAIGQNFTTVGLAGFTDFLEAGLYFEYNFDSSSYSNAVLGPDGNNYLHFHENIVYHIDRGKQAHDSWVDGADIYFDRMSDWQVEFALERAAREIHGEEWTTNRVGSAIRYAMSAGVQPEGAAKLLDFGGPDLLEAVVKNQLAQQGIGSLSGAESASRRPEVGSLAAAESTAQTVANSRIAVEKAQQAAAAERRRQEIARETAARQLQGVAGNYINNESAAEAERNRQLSQNAQNGTINGQSSGGSSSSSSSWTSSSSSSNTYSYTGKSGQNQTYSTSHHVTYSNSSTNQSYSGNWGSGGITPNSGNGSGVGAGYADTSLGGFGPVIFDLDGDGIELNYGLNTAFDWDGDGFKENSGWFGAGDAVLMIDLGNDGKFTQAKEVALADWTAVEGDTDFQALASHFDSNKDGTFDAKDARFGEFRIWQDIDGDVEVDAGELTTLAQSKISSIDLKSYKSFGENPVEIGSNIIHGTAVFNWSDGSTGAVGDVEFTYLTDGFHITSDDNGGYSLKYENGATSREFLAVDPANSPHLTLSDESQIGAKGDAQRNIFDARSMETDVTLLGEGGYDNLYGGNGNDTLIGGSKNDVMLGGDGDDLLVGGEGSLDYFRGGAGNDTMFADATEVARADRIRGGAGTDTLFIEGDLSLTVNATTLETEVIYSGGGNDRMVGQAETSTVMYGGKGNDNITGGNKNDVLSGDGGNDTIAGSKGDDTVVGGDGNDRVYGNDGKDTLNGGKGVDSLYGGAGDDRYVYNKGDGKDTIHDHATEDYTQAYQYKVTEAYKYNYRKRVSGGKYPRYVNELRTGHRSVTKTGYRTATRQIDGGVDTLAFGFGISVEDLFVQTSGDNIYVGLRNDDVDAGGASNPLANLMDRPMVGFSYDQTFSFGSQPKLFADMVTVINWQNQMNRIEQFEFADGNMLDTSRITHARSGYDANDTLHGRNTGDWLSGGNGNDTLHGNAGNDILVGGDGNDTIYAGPGSVDHLNNSTTLVTDRDFVFGGEGNDYLSGGAGDDYLLGEAGNDRIYGGNDNDTLAGGAGDDWIEGNDGNDMLMGGSGSDTLRGGAGDDTYVYFRGDGQDTIWDHAWETKTRQVWTGRYQWRGGGKNARYVKEYRTQRYNSQIDGGRDTLQFGWTIAIEDLFVHRTGYDFHVGIREYRTDGGEIGLWDLKDQLKIQSGVHAKNRIETWLFGDGSGFDMSNVTNARSGLHLNDRWNGTNGGDLLSGGGGNDTFYSLDGDDILIGGEGNDYLDGGNGDDDLFGGDGNDFLQANHGNDYVIGGAGDDTIYGWGGDDVLSGGTGNDSLKGGVGDDTYIFNRGDGQDTIDETGYKTVREAYTYETGRKIPRSIGSGKSRRTVWVNETRTGYRNVTQAVEGGWDKLQFGTNILLSDLDINLTGNDLVVTLASLDGSELTDDQVTIKNWTTKQFRVEMFTFFNQFAVDMSDISWAKSAREGNQTIWGGNTTQGNWLSGGKGNDFLGGRNSHDILVGGEGNDRLYGYGGGDTYIIEFESGIDTVLDDGYVASIGTIASYYPENDDALLFGAGITLEDLSIQSSGNHMVFALRDAENVKSPLSADNRVTVLHWRYQRYRIETLQFFNGQDFDFSHIEKAVTGTAANQRLNGTNGGDWLDGEAGDDTIIAYGGHDYVLGREGNDRLYGYAGDDVMSGGTGDDWIHGAQDDDTLLGGEGNDTIYGSTGSDMILGGEGNDIIDGGTQNDTLIGDTGNDIFTLSAGDDVYVFGRGDGKDEYRGHASGYDIISFESDVKQDDLWFSRAGNDLVVQILSTEDSIKMKGWFGYTGGNYARTYGFYAEDELLKATDVSRLVNAMAGFKPNNGVTAWGVRAGEVPKSVQVASDVSWRAVANSGGGNISFNG